MKAVQLFEWGQPPRLADVPEPKVTGPWDVIVRVAGAGVCRTDLHIMEGVWREAGVNPQLPFTLGHENAGWVEEIGAEVANLAKGDPVILHPQPSCGFCRACRAGNDMHCTGNAFFPGFDGTDGGYAEYLKTSARAVIKLAPGTDPASLAPFADAGITAMHAVKRIVPQTYPGSSAVVIGVGGLGHFGIQILKALCSARVIALDTRPERLEFARRLGADAAFQSGSDGGVNAVHQATDGLGADVVLDFVGEHGTPDAAMKMLRRGGTYSIIGYGGSVSPRTVDMILGEFSIVGNIVGTYNDLAELMELNRQGKVKITAQEFPLEDAADVLRQLDEGGIEGRAVLLPSGARQASAPRMPAEVGVGGR
ncbi:MAG: NAD(P)-dependent alcohol dehydrogenase [Chloroflexota bacterium]|nr:NAD(P)-dependent alcohol dehydrogenase [Chloroflexota bacterium]